jgi:non-ribosomal peptide synthetase component E (peptide arylation enzyme)
MILDSDERIKELTDKGWWGKETILDLFLKDVREFPDEVAIVDPPNRSAWSPGEPQRWTYAQLDQASSWLAVGLQKAGLKKDDVIMVQLPNIIELAAVYLAAVRIGAIVTPVPVQYRTHELKSVMSIAEPKAYITTNNFSDYDYISMIQEMQPDFPGLKSLFSLGDNLPEGVLSLTGLLTTPVEDEIPHEDVSANEVFTICWTSGTESEPKGVPRSHNQWIWMGYFSVEVCEFEHGHALLNPFPMINMAGIGGMFIPWLLVAGKLVLHQPFDLQAYLGQIMMEKINYTVAPPSLLNMLLMRPEVLAKVDLSSVKNIGSGSAPLSPWMVSKWQEDYNKPVLNIFGSNEGESFISGMKEFPDPTMRAQYFPRFGKPGFSWIPKGAAQMLTKLVADGKEVTEPGVPGEMAVKSPGIFTGYYRRPELTKKVFDEDGYFYTGDLFEIAGEDGNLNSYKFVGRAKDIIIRGGMNISAEEIEGLIVSIPNVAEVAVVGYPDERLGEKACAVVVPKPGESVTLEEIIAALKDKDIAVYKLPERLVTMESLPRNPLGKVLKRKIREMI